MTLGRVRQVLGGATLLLAIAIVGAVMVPEQVATVPAVRAAIDAAATLDSETIGLGGAVVVTALLLLALVVSRPDSTGGDAFDALRTNPPETVAEDDSDRVGRVLDSAISESAAESSGVVKKRLRDIAEEQVRRYGPEAQDPTVAVARGSWTDNRPAALFIGEQVQPTLLERLRSWLDPDAERRRRIRATVAALEALAEANR